MYQENGEAQTGGGPAGALPFIYGHVDPTLIPIDRLREAAGEALSQYGAQALNYGIERGCGVLLTYLRTKFARDEGLEIGRHNLMLTVGASGGLDAVCRLCTQPGDTVLVEAPSYHEALAVIKDYPVRIVSVPVDDEGLIVEALAERLKDPAAKSERHRLLYTIPTFQNPSGVTLTTARRFALLELARQHELLIVEDDVYRDLAYGQSAPPSLYALDTQKSRGTVIRLGSFSKILAPGLRLGWLMGPSETVARLTSSGLYASGGGANPFCAFVTAVFCQKGWLEPHIARLVEAYGRRRDIMLRGLEESMSADVHWTRPEGGFFVWLTLPEQLKAQDVLAAAHSRSINFLTGEPFSVQGGGEHHIRLPFSYIPPQEMAKGVRELANIISGFLGDS